jgi:transposase-like protein
MRWRCAKERRLPVTIVSLERMFRQLESWGQDPEDRRFGDLSDLVIQNLKWMIEESFEWEARHRIGCSSYERSEDRKDYRNGYRLRDILSRFGRLKDVRIPRLRFSGFVPCLLEPGRLALREVEELIAKCLLCGASRREVMEMLALVLGYPPSGSIIARVQKQLDVAAHEFRMRPLAKRYRYLFLDGIVVTIKEGMSGKAWTVLVAVGIDEAGIKEVIGYMRAPKESAVWWRRLLAELVERGLSYDELSLAISDDCGAIAAAIEDVFGDAPHQLCWTHRMVRVGEKFEEVDRADGVAGLSQVYLAHSRPAAIRAFKAWKARWETKYPRLVAQTGDDLGKLLAFYSCPRSHWMYVRTNSPIERLMRDIRARTYGWAGFANKESCDRLLYGLFDQRNGDWKDDPKLDFTHQS